MNSEKKYSPRTGKKEGSPRFLPKDAEDTFESSHYLPGVKPVLEMLEASPERVETVYLRKGRHGKEMDRILDICRTSKVRFSLLEAAAFSKIYAGSSQGVVARLFERGFVELEDLISITMNAPMPLIIALDQVQDPGNAGAIARTLYALGGAGFIIPRHNGVFLGAAAAKAAAGALDNLSVARAGNLGQAIDTAKKAGFTVYGASSSSQTTLLPVADLFSFSPDFPAVLVLGSEESGLRPIVQKRCDLLLRIPMLRPFDSLNVAQAGAMLMASFLKASL